MRFRSLAAGALALFAPLATLVATSPPPAGAAATSLALPSVGWVREVVVQSDGKIVLAFITSFTRFTVVRLDPHGALDPTFGGDGIAETVVGPVANTLMTDLAVQPDGRIIAAGHTGNSSTDSSFALVRFRADGALDPTFSGDGKVVTDLGLDDASDPSIAVRPDGTIVAAGPAATSGITMAGYRSDGSLDTAFGGDGIVHLDPQGPEERVGAVEVDNAGNAVVAGSTSPGASQDAFLARVRPNGQLDPAFGAAGIVLWDSGLGNDYSRSMAIQSDGRIVTAGGSGNEAFVALSRYLPSGAPDASFGNGGHVLLSTGEDAVAVAGVDVALLLDGRIAVTGVSNFGSGDVDVYLAVVSAAGAPDPAFDGDDGVLAVELGPAGQADTGGYVAPTRDGKLMVAGNYGNTPGTGFAGQLSVVAVPTIAAPADLAVTIGATPNPTSAGPVELLTRVRNDGPDAATAVTLTLDVSQATGPGRTSQGTCKTFSTGLTTCSLGAIPAGREALVSVGTAVTGFEEGVFATASVSSASVDLDSSDNAATTEVIVNPS